MIYVLFLFIFSSDISLVHIKKAIAERIYLLEKLGSKNEDIKIYNNLFDAIEKKPYDSNIRYMLKGILINPIETKIDFMKYMKILWIYFSTKKSHSKEVLKMNYRFFKNKFNSDLNEINRFIECIKK